MEGLLQRVAYLPDALQVSVMRAGDVDLFDNSKCLALLTDLSQYICVLAIVVQLLFRNLTEVGQVRS